MTYKLPHRIMFNQIYNLFINRRTFTYLLLLLLVVVVA